MTTKTVDVQDAPHQLVDRLVQLAADTEIIFMDGNQPRARLVARYPAHLPSNLSGYIPALPALRRQRSEMPCVVRS